MSADARLVDAHLDATVSLRRTPGVILAAIAALAIVAVCAPSAVALPADRAFEKVSPDDKDGQDILNGLDKAAPTATPPPTSASAPSPTARAAGCSPSFSSGRTPPAGAPSRRHPPQAGLFSLASSLLVDFSDDARSSVPSLRGRRPRPSTARPRAREPLPPRPRRHRAHPDVRPAARRRRRLPAEPRPTAAAPPTCRWAPTTSTPIRLAGLPTTSGPDAVAGVTNAYFSTGNHDVRARLRAAQRHRLARPAATIGPQLQPRIQRGLRRRLADLLDLRATPRSTCGSTGPTTDHVSASQRNNPDPNGVQPKTYQYATPDGRFVYFTSGEKLTNNSQAEPGNPRPLPL